MQVLQYFAAGPAPMNPVPQLHILLNAIYSNLAFNESGFNYITESIDCQGLAQDYLF